MIKKIYFLTRVQYYWIEININCGNRVGDLIGHKGIVRITMISNIFLVYTTTCKPGGFGYLLEK